MSKMILFNSPRNVGKSKVIEYLNSKGYNLTSAECKESLHKLTMTLFGVYPDRYWEIYNTRELKEVPLSDFSATLPYSEICKMQELVGRWATKDIFGGHRKVEFTIREAMIYVSEIVVKSRWGNDWFGKERVRKMKGYENLKDIGYFNKGFTFTDDSAAFVDELYPLIDYLRQENILLLRIHRDGFTFEGDSRNYIPDGIIDNTIDVYNNGTEQEYFDQVEEIVKRFIDE